MLSKLLCKLGIHDYWYVYSPHGVKFYLDYNYKYILNKQCIYCKKDKIMHKDSTASVKENLK